MRTTIEDSKQLKDVLNIFIHEVFKCLKSHTFAMQEVLDFGTSSWCLLSTTEKCTEITEAKVYQLRLHDRCA